ncbi:hypothetical protein EDB80DRAFT_881495 [Ilyonectria destructans]|nr:hypothetical protein EDB80DRAFT_881495 [Ilyonectria destructans]
MFEVTPDNSQYEIALLPVPGKNVWWGEVSGSHKDSTNPISSSFLRIVAGEPSATPEHPCDDELVVEDETGKKETLHEGETFFIRKGSKIIFSAPRFAIAFKISAQLPMTL